jgi:hypothetical protein
VLVPSLEDLIRSASAEWDPAIERALFGSGEAPVVAEAITRWVNMWSGPIADAVFYRPGVGIVVGLALDDGTEVVVKIHRWNVSIERLAAIQEVQACVARTDARAPRPLVAPIALAGGIATVEELRRGTGANGRDPRVRRTMAMALYEFVEAARPLTGTAEVGPPLVLRPPGAPLWGEPHDLRFDFAGTAEGAEWIDALATQARHRPEVIGHFDWRIENLGFEDDALVAIYDWDSVAKAPEAVLVGNNAAQFTADWSTLEPDPLPTFDEMAAFVADYERARGAPFAGPAREALDAANLLLCAYGARCQHSDAIRHPELTREGVLGWIRLLRERAGRTLA